MELLKIVQGQYNRLGIFKNSQRTSLKAFEITEGVK